MSTAFKMNVTFTQTFTREIIVNKASSIGDAKEAAERIVGKWPNVIEVNKVEFVEMTEPRAYSKRA